MSVTQAAYLGMRQSARNTTPTVFACFVFIEHLSACIIFCLSHKLGEVPHETQANRPPVAYT